jgi:hypothetical protein
MDRSVFQGFLKMSKEWGHSEWILNRTGLQGLTLGGGSG